MSITITPIDASRPHFAGRVSGVDIARGISADEATAIDRGMDEFAVLVFHDQVIDDDQQYAFHCHFGAMEKATGDIAAADQRRLSMDVNDISNLDRDGNVVARDDRRRLFGIGNMLWHSDSSFKAVPAKYSALSARVIPASGGNTEFADMRAAWDTLEPALQEECLPLVCEHSQIHSRGKLGFTGFTDEEREKWAPVRQRLVRRHPVTGRRSLYLSSHIGGIDGWPVPEARMFIQDLTEHATRPHHVYSHAWRQWDLVMWDNRTTMHRARRYDHTEVRDLHRTTGACASSTLDDPA